MRLIFIHGSGASGACWSEQLRRFSDAVAVDLPGHPAGDPCPSVDGYADWLSGQYLSQDDEDVVLVGHSLGGAIALSVALARPDRLAGVVLIGSGARLRVHPDFLQGLRDDGSAFQDEFLRWLHRRVETDRAKDLIARSRQIGPEVMLNDLRACDGFDVMDRLSEVGVPILAICGDEDEMTPAKYSRHLAAQVPDGSVVTIPGGSHLVLAEQPEAVNAALADFLTGLRSRSSGSPASGR